MAFNPCKLKVDYARVTDGVRVEIDDGAAVIVASTNSPEFKAMMRKLVRQNARALGVDDADAVKLDQQITARIYAETILKGWENFEDESGAPVPFSVEKAYEYLMIPSFFTLVSDIATNEDRYRAETAAAVEKK